MTPGLVYRVKINARPAPLYECCQIILLNGHLNAYSVHTPKPKTITSPYLFRREIYWPDIMDKMACKTTNGMYIKADVITGY